MPLLTASESGANALNELLSQFGENGQRLSAGPAPTGSAGLDQVGSLALVRIRTPWTIARKTDDAGSSATALGERLQPGDDTDDDPLLNTDYREPILTRTAPSTITVSDAVEDLLYAGATVAIAGSSSDGWFTIKTVSTTSGTTTIEFNELVPANAVGKSLVIPRSMGRVGSSRLVTVVTRSRHDVTVAINAGGEFVLLSRPRCWVILNANLGPATIVTAGSRRLIRPTKAQATILIESDAAGEPDDLEVTTETLTVANYDEGLNLLAETTCEVELSGINWIPISPSCNVSLLRDS